MIRMTFAVVLLVIAGVSATGTDAQLPSGPTAPRTAIQFGQATDVASVNFVLARPAEVLPAQPGLTPPARLVYSGWSRVNLLDGSISVMMAKSTDGGLTFGPEQELYRTDNSTPQKERLESFQIVATRHQVYCAVLSDRTHLPSNGGDDVWVKGSPDEGKTWSNLVLVNTVTSGTPLRADGDQLRVAAGYEKCHIMWETDAASTTHEDLQYACVKLDASNQIQFVHTETQLSTNVAGTKDVDNPSLFVVSDSTNDHLLCSWTDIRTGVDNVFARFSTDGGTTWSTEQQLSADTTAGNDIHGGEACAIAGKNYYVVYNGHTRSTDEPHISFSNDGGQTWTTSLRLTDAPAGFDADSPRVWALDNRVVVTFHDDRNGDSNNGNTCYMLVDDNFANGFKTNNINMPLDFGFNTTTNRVRTEHARVALHGQSIAFVMEVSDYVPGTQTAEDAVYAVSRDGKTWPKTLQWLTTDGSLFQSSPDDIDEPRIIGTALGDVQCIWHSDRSGLGNQAFSGGLKLPEIAYFGNTGGFEVFNADPAAQGDQVYIGVTEILWIQGAPPSLVLDSMGFSPCFQIGALTIPALFIFPTQFYAEVGNDGKALFPNAPVVPVGITLEAFALGLRSGQPVWYTDPVTYMNKP